MDLTKKKNNCRIIMMKLEEIRVKHYKMKGTAKMYISEVIGNEVDEWEKGDWIFIKSSPGSGKTTFCNEYARKEVQHGKKVLFLFPRKILVEQQKSEAMDSIALQGESCLKEIDRITYTTYQRVEKLLEEGFDVTDGHDVIICDEAHYFLTDSEFNLNTQRSLNAILSKHNATIIFLSGTINDFQKYLEARYDIKYQNK